MGRGLQGKSMIDVNSASDPFDFDADPNPDQDTYWNEMDPNPSCEHFCKIY